MSADLFKIEDDQSQEKVESIREMQHEETESKLDLKEESQPESTERHEDGEKPLFEGEIVNGREGTAKKVVRSREASRERRPESKPVNIDVGSN